MNLIVFDIDDTLTNSEYQHQWAFVKAMKEFGISEINQNWIEYKHHTDSYILKENYENNHADKFDFSFIQDFEKRMTQLILGLKTASEIKGAKQILNFITNESDYAISFATGSLLEPAFIKLDQVGIEYHKELVVGSNEIYEREGIVKMAIEKSREFHNVKSFENIISVGDGIWDMTTARNIGVNFIGIGMENYQDFKNAQIKVHIKDWHEFDLKQAEQKLGISNAIADN